MANISRRIHSVTGVMAGTQLANSTAVDIGDAAGLVVYPKAASGGLTVYSASDPHGTFVPLNDKSGTAITLGATTANQAHVVNPEVYYVGAIKLLAATTATSFDADIKT